jgi:hypothetical protein
MLMSFSIAVLLVGLGIYYANNAIMVIFGIISCAVCCVASAANNCIREELLQAERREAQQKAHLAEMEANRVKARVIEERARVAELRALPPPSIPVVAQPQPKHADPPQEGRKAAAAVPMASVVPIADDLDALRRRLAELEAGQARSANPGRNMVI